MYASLKPAPASTSSTSRRRRWACESRPDIALRSGSVNGIFSSPWTRATSSTRSISRVVSRIRQVGTWTSQPGTTSKPRRSRLSFCSCSSISTPTIRFARSVRKWTTGGFGQVARARPSPRSSARRRGRPGAASPGAPRAGRGTGRRPSPSGSSPRCAASGAPSSTGSSPGSKLAASSRMDVVVSVTSVSSPPMIPAKAIAPSASAMTRSAGVELAQVPVEARELLARARAAHDDPAAAQRLEVEGVERVPEREHDVVRHVDDVRDRAHPGRLQARLQPRRRLPDRDVAEEPADVARAALVVLDGHVRVLAAGRLGLLAPAAAGARRGRAPPPRARCRRPRGSRGGCGSSRSRGSPRRAGARRAAACPAPRAPGGRGCRRARR